MTTSVDRGRSTSIVRWIVAAVERRFSSRAVSLGHAIVAQHQVAQGAEYDEERQEDGRVRPEWKTGTPCASLALEDRRNRYRRGVPAFLELAWLRASAGIIQGGRCRVDKLGNGKLIRKFATRFLRSRVGVRIE